ncbi:hypothetical protein BDZ97DRAFT_1867534 [Flammula alnicola]|nr:hypothetical protein BDZ97DRAFT_1867534 [Flammula alnicola]
MKFVPLTTLVALAMSIATCAAYSVSAYQGALCNTGVPNQPTLTVVGSMTSTPATKSCVQIPFQGNSISVAGCALGGTVTVYGDRNCLLASSSAIQASGVLCLQNTSFNSFAITGC